MVDKMENSGEGFEDVELDDDDLDDIKSTVEKAGPRYVAIVKHFAGRAGLSEEWSGGL